jgi:hypothetical protein
MSATSKAASVVVLSFMAAVTSMSVSSPAAADEQPTVAFPDTWMIRLGAYVVDGSNTQVSVNSALGGLGTTIDFQRDLGGEDGDTIPRIDAYYRFNERHRIDFTAFSIDRKGERTLSLDITIEDEVFNVNETVFSDVKYEVYRLGYAYSFYHSPKVELSLTAGLNVTSYDLEFRNEAGDKVQTAGVSVPLPVFGLRLGYAITPKWYVRYVSEAFFIELDDALRGALLNYELNTEYKIFDNFALGAGLARVGLDVEVDDDDWRGQVTDSYRGYMLFGTFYF